ncbi:VOC family protein [Sphingomonas ginsenosidivorax]|uniref:VOC family protein n=1 Tax=Sphingomonas ginsenosidivorax TaxID=862135 RepID=A0A5C6UC80_9SPHN|nr:VOC family protein [Sphingomonas ginsenosidivorax]TXC70309.1 VOC family protein [Sphingomonas ginsenosidivorax]
MTKDAGIPAWFELTTPDDAKAQAFYAATIGWTIAPSGMAEHGEYLIATAPDGAAVAGIMTPAPGAPSLSGWSIYFGTPDVDAAAAKVRDLGGSIPVAPMDIPGVGRFAIAADPQGVGFLLMTGESSDPSTAFAQGTQHGHGVWVELATPDPDGALAFYGALFGWTREGAMPMGPMGDYVFLGSGEARPGAVMSSTTTGAPARWNWYAYVPDIDAAIAAATDLGGTLLQGPDPIPGGDYSANVGDTSGAQIGLVGPRTTAVT